MSGSENNSYFTLVPSQNISLLPLIPQINVKEQEAPQQIQHIAHVDNVPSIVPPQPQNKPQTKGRKYYHALEKIRYISERYFINLFNQDYDRIVNRIFRIERQDHNSKTLSEATAVVLFFQYFDRISTDSIRQFCRRNDLSTLVFHKKYKAYYRIFIKDKEYEQIRKMNPVILQSELIQDNELIQKIIKPRQQPIYVNNATAAISIIYDYLFKSTFYQKNRRQIIEKLVLHYQNLDRRIIQQVNWIEDKTATLYYIIFHILRVLKSGKLFTQFRNAVLRRAGIKLNEGDKKEVNKIFNKYYVERPIELLVQPNQEVSLPETDVV